MSPLRNYSRSSCRDFSRSFFWEFLLKEFLQRLLLYFFMCSSAIFFRNNCRNFSRYYFSNYFLSDFSRSFFSTSYWCFHGFFCRSFVDSLWVSLEILPGVSLRIPPRGILSRYSRVHWGITPEVPWGTEILPVVHWFLWQIHQGFHYEFF